MISFSMCQRPSARRSIRCTRCRTSPWRSGRGRYSASSAFRGGKSTLVRCINLLERPTQGSVVVDGKEMTSLTPAQLRQARKKIGMIFQHFNLLPSRTVFGNVAYPLRGSGLSKQQVAEKVRRLLALVDIADKENAYPSQLSGGQKQRVAIARALANDPRCCCATRPPPPWTPRPPTPSSACSSSLTSSWA